VVVPTFGDARVPVTGTSPKLVDLVHSYQFSMVLFIDFWLSWSSERSGKPEVRLRGPRQNSQIWSILRSFLCYYSLILGPGVIQTFREPRGPLTGTSPKLTDFVHSYHLSVLLFNVFWFMWSYERLAKPGDRLRGPHQNSQILSVSASFLCYYSLILGLGAIQ
jgi:hypothetical protein